MKNKLQDKLWYEIVPMRLDSSRDQLCDLMTVQKSTFRFFLFIIEEIIEFNLDKKFT